MNDMFTVDKKASITIKLIKEVIDFNEKRRADFNKKENYYLGKHAILSRIKAPTLSNNQIVTNHAKYITDTNTGYLMGNPVEYQVQKIDDKDTSEPSIQPILLQYKKQVIPDLDNEIAKDLSIFGRQYEYVYNVNNDIRSKDIDVRNCIVVYDDTVEHEPMFAVIYEKGKEKDKFTTLLVIDNRYIIEYWNGDKIARGPAKPHFFGEVPVIEYHNNSENMGDFEPVLTLIDAHNTIQSDRVNDKEQLVEAILVFYGAGISPKQRNRLKLFRILSKMPKDARVEYLTKMLNETEIEVLKKTIENDIHKISMTPNMSDQEFAGNSSGVALKYKLLAFEQLIKNKQRYMEKGLLKRFRLYNTYLTKLKKMSLVEDWRIEVVFKRNLPQNDLETSQMILNLTDLVDKETLVGQLSFVRNAKETIKAKEDEVEEETTDETPNTGTETPSTTEPEAEVPAEE